MDLPAYELNKAAVIEKVDYQIDVKKSISIYDVTGSKIFDRFARVLQPLVNRFPALEKLLKFKPIYDLFVFQRQMKSGMIVSAAYAKNKGARIVYELDDYVLAMDPTNPALKVFNEPENKGNIMTFLMLADAVTVSTEHLKKLLSPYNDNIHVLPNSINFDIWDPVYRARKARKSDGRIRLGWAGSATHLKDIYQIKDVLVSMLRKYPDLVLKIVGFEFHLIFKDFTPFLDRIEFVEFQSLTAYPETLIDIDVGIAPLFDSPFNRAKSNVKYLEYSAAGIPCVATNVEPYKCIDNGVTGFLASVKNHAATWERALSTLIENESTRNRIGEAAREYVKKNFDIKKNAHKWADVYEKIMKAPATSKLVDLMKNGDGGISAREI